MKDNVNIEKYHLTKRDLEIVYLRYKKRMSGPEVAKKLGITYGQVKYCLQKFNVKQYVNDVVIPDIQRETEHHKIRIIDKVKIEHSQITHDKRGISADTLSFKERREREKYT